MKISRIATALLAVALMAFLATDVMAQRGGGRSGGGGGQGGPGGRGPGGPGGRGPGGPGGRGGFGFGTPSLGQTALGLLRVEEVRVEVELMPDQEEALKKMAEQGRPERPNFNFQEATEEERQEFFAKMQKQREERTAKMQEQLEEILLPDQFDRLQEIAVQVLDVNALTVKDVATELKMSESQSAELKEVQAKLRDEMRAKMGEIFQGGGGDREAIREKFAQLREENNKKILDVLTSEQRSDFEKMKGEKFEMPEDAMRAMFGGGRGGRGGGPGGGPGGGAGGRGGRGGGPGGGEGGDGGGRQRRRPQAE